jgi:hypothetical protein
MSKTFLRHTLIKKYFWHFVFDHLSLFLFTIWKSIVYNLFCRDGIYFDKILVSEYKIFKRSNKYMMPDVGQRAPKKVSGLEFCKNHQWTIIGKIFVSLLVRDGVNFLLIIVDFSVISLIKADIFSLFHRGDFPEKAVSTLKLSPSTF